MRSIALQIIAVLLVLAALFLTIPPIPSVDVGHGYDTFPNPRLFIGIFLLLSAAFVSIKYLNFPKVYWAFTTVLYVLFSFAVHVRVWW